MGAHVIANDLDSSFGQNRSLSENIYVIKAQSTRDSSLGHS